ncbi:MAG: hypothetical protein ACI4Q9_01815 [Candidatus Methanomethylophilaceae archaeon]
MEYDEPHMRKALEDFRYAYRFNKLKNNDLIAYRRDSVKEVAQRNYRKVRDLEKKEILALLGRCETVYFTDLTGSYDDPAQQIVDDNPHGALSGFLITLARGKIMARGDYELELKHMSTDIRTELASLIDPQRYVPMNMFTRSAFGYLGIPLPGDDFTGYLRFMSLCKELIGTIEDLGILTADLTTVYEFLLLTYSKRCR